MPGAIIFNTRPIFCKSFFCPANTRTMALAVKVRSAPSEDHPSLKTKGEHGLK